MIIKHLRVNAQALSNNKVREAGGQPILAWAIRLPEPMDIVK
jgi:hypothetical protein